MLQSAESLGVVVHEDVPVVSSRTVAEKFDRNHKDILRRIERLDCSEEFNGRNFALVDYTDAKGESRPEYLMTRDGFTFCVMGMTGKKAAQFKEAYINAFNEMERRLRAQNNSIPPEALPWELLGRLSGVVRTTLRSIDEANQTAGIECRKDSAVVDEIPSSYKDIDEVMHNQSDLVTPIYELNQLLCIKG